MYLFLFLWGDGVGGPAMAEVSDLGAKPTADVLAGDEGSTIS